MQNNVYTQQTTCLLMNSDTACSEVYSLKKWKMLVKSKSCARGWQGHSFGDGQEETFMLNDSAWNPTTLTCNPICVHQSCTSHKAWLGADLTQFGCSFYPMTHKRDGKYLVCHQYSPFLWPWQTLLINHTDSFPLSLNIASGSFSTRLSRQQQLIHHREEEMKHVCQPGLEAMKFSKSVFTRGKEIWHGMPKEAYYI